ncbi:M48 family metallopeptidase [Natrialba aegyptia]|uniref:Heat shock protein HtpX n=1 Tax=Natrialba aegyptia DSM 13077 TaxID=1227491 RepID=M0BED9_9EURY|nr:M56 family metallopeptidase [Natrialba aegyptia]ELZ07989.1 heat shock protein HtpX [Natrialba aegyptia DSM 13077]
MRLTGPIGLAVRAILAAVITVGALLVSAYTVTVFVAAFLIVLPMQLGLLEFTETRFLWALAAGSVLSLPCFALVIGHTIRRERQHLLEETVSADAVDAETARKLEATATRLGIQFGVVTPEVRLHPSDEPLAYTTYGPTDPVVAIRRQGTPFVVVSRGLVRTLSKTEIEAVLAHEFAHVGNDDLQLTSWLLVPLFAAEFVYENDEDEKWQFDPFGWTLMAVALVGLGVFSRGRELAADRAAVEATGNPGTLASALERLAERRSRRPAMDLRHTRSRSAVNVLPTLDEDGDPGGFRAMHPPLEVRLEQLRSVAA